jgi:hypothetical protein
MRPLFAAAYLAMVGALAACAASGSDWTSQSWASQAMRSVTGGPFGFSAEPYGDGLKFKLTIKTGAVGLAGAETATFPGDEDLMAAATNAAPEGCKVKSVTRTPDGGAVADYDCGG